MPWRRMSVFPHTRGFEALGALATNLAAIAAWQEQIEWTARMIVTCLGIATGAIVLYHQLKSRRIREALPRDPPNDG